MRRAHPPPLFFERARSVIHIAGSENGILVEHPKYTSVDHPADGRHRLTTVMVTANI